MAEALAGCGYPACKKPEKEVADWKPNRAPSTQFLCVVIGMIIAGWSSPAPINVRTSFDWRDYFSLRWIFGGAVTGALVGTIITLADKRTVTRRSR